MSRLPLPFRYARNDGRIFEAPHIAEFAGVTVLLLAIVVALQLLAGSYGAEFGNDEASHYVSGLLVHDYLRSGFPSSPLAYLKAFHSHYPLVGIGHWGPLYYFAEGLWMTLVSTSRGSILLLSAAMTTAVAILTYAFTVPRLGRLAGLFAAFGFIVLPLVQESSSELMLDIPIALLCLLAMIAYARYFDTVRLRFSVIFAVLAAAALLIKGNSACLALFPPFAVIFGRRFDLLRRASFWAPVPIVAILAAPWYALTYGQAEAGFRFNWGWAYAITATAANTEILLATIGQLIFVASVVGFAVVLMPTRGRPADDGLVAAAALVAAVWTFQSFTPAAIQDRYLVPLLPPLLILAAFGVLTVCSRIMSRLRERFLSRHIYAVVPALAFSILGASLAPGTVTHKSEACVGFMGVARQIWKDRIDSNPAVLVVANGLGEADAIAELAMDDPRRPSLFVVRGSRLLGGGGYNNQDYVPKYRTAAEVMAAIDAYSIPFVLFQPDCGGVRWEHMQQVQEAQRLYPDRWEIIYAFPPTRPEIVLYRLRDNYERTADTAKLTALSAPRALAP